MPHARRRNHFDPTDERQELLHLAALLSAQSIDLRAEYEAKLRILTDIQREIENLRSPTASVAQRHRAHEQLDKRFIALAAANRDASEMLRMIRAEFDRIHRKAASPIPRVGRSKTLR